MSKEQQYCDCRQGRDACTCKPAGEKLDRYYMQAGDGPGVYPEKDKAGEWCLFDDAQRLLSQLRDELAQRDAEVDRLSALINTPHTDEWFEAVRLEAAHQIERWGTRHDAGKEPADWFWLLGYLGQKAMTAQMAGDDEKARHHTISSGAMLLNWFRAMVGDSTAMRPGIEVKS